MEVAGRAGRVSDIVSGEWRVVSGECDHVWSTGPPA